MFFLPAAEEGPVEGLVAGAALEPGRVDAIAGPVAIATVNALEGKEEIARAPRLQAAELACEGGRGMPASHPAQLERPGGGRPLGAGKEEALVPGGGQALGK